MSKVSQDRRRELTETQVTLNGKPARISGAMRRFATVTDMTTRLSAEWAWPTVEHVVTEKNGAFTS